MSKLSQDQLKQLASSSSGNKLPSPLLSDAQSKEVNDDLLRDRLGSGHRRETL